LEDDEENQKTAEVGLLFLTHFYISDRNRPIFCDVTTLITVSRLAKEHIAGLQSLSRERLKPKIKPYMWDFLSQPFSQSFNFHSHQLQPIADQ